MNEETYTIYSDNEKIAEGMTLETALILIKGLMHTYYNEEKLSYSIVREWKGRIYKEKEWEYES